MFYAMLIPVAIVSALGLLFGISLALGAWRNPQTPEERKKAIESGACSHCLFGNVCHMDYDGHSPEECHEYNKESKKTVDLSNRKQENS